MELLTVSSALGKHDVRMSVIDTLFGMMPSFIISICELIRNHTSHIHCLFLSSPTEQNYNGRTVVMRESIPHVVGYLL